MATIILPKSAITEINKEYVKVEIPDKNYQEKNINWEMVESLSNSLKNIYGDGVEFQNKVREEWDEKYQTKIS